MCVNKPVTKEVLYSLFRECHLTNMTFVTCHNIKTSPGEDRVVRTGFRPLEGSCDDDNKTSVSIQYGEVVE
jgi:hypothetical protein